MAFEDERELEQDPEMKDIYFLKSELSSRNAPSQPKIQRKGLGLIGEPPSEILTSREMRS